MPNAVPIRWFAFVALFAWGSAVPLHAGESTFCEELRSVVSAADAGNGLREVTGADAGMYHETSVQLDGAKFCASFPDSHAAPSWRCVMGSDRKYTVALQELARLHREVEDCLGDAWTSTAVSRTEDHLREIVMRRDGSAGWVRLLATLDVEPFKGWSGHRIVLVVESPPAGSTD